MRIIGLLLFILASILILGHETPSATAQGVPTFHCAMDDSCPEILIDGDPHATIGAAPSPFRGYGDPSLEYDPDTETLWLSYSWLDVLVHEGNINFAVRTHLAQSTDSGDSFQFVRAVNETTLATHPAPGNDEPGWVLHEVSTLVRDEGGWSILWLSYFNSLGRGTTYNGLHYVYSHAPTPGELGNNAEPWLAGRARFPDLSVRFNFDAMPELADCTVLTEPALFYDGTDTYLASGCLVIENGQRLSERDRLVLLRETDDGYEYVGALLDGDDAAYLNVNRLEQANLSFSRNGDIILIVTPILDQADPKHRGCIVYTVADITTATVERDTVGHPVPRYILTSDGNGLGPGLCTYDPQSETGIMLVITAFDLASEPPDILFSLRATGVHP